MVVQTALKRTTEIRKVRYRKDSRGTLVIDISLLLTLAIGVFLWHPCISLQTLFRTMSSAVLSVLLGDRCSMKFLVSTVSGGSWMSFVRETSR